MRLRVFTPVFIFVLSCMFSLPASAQTVDIELSTTGIENIGADLDAIYGCRQSLDGNTLLVQQNGEWLETAPDGIYGEIDPDLKKAKRKAKRFTKKAKTVSSAKKKKQFKRKAKKQKQLRNTLSAARETISGCVDASVAFANDLACTILKDYTSDTSLFLANGGKCSSANVPVVGVNIFTNGSFLYVCSGVSVAPDKVITSGNCLENADTVGKNVKLVIETNDGTEITAKKYRVHPSFDRSNTSLAGVVRDMAVVTLPSGSGIPTVDLYDPTQHTLRPGFTLFAGVGVTEKSVVGKLRVSFLGNYSTSHSGENVAAFNYAKKPYYNRGVPGTSDSGGALLVRTESEQWVLVAPFVFRNGSKFSDYVVGGPSVVVNKGFLSSALGD